MDHFESFESVWDVVIEVVVSVGSKVVGNRLRVGIFGEIYLARAQLSASECSLTQR